MNMRLTNASLHSKDGRRLAILFIAVTACFGEVFATSAAANDQERRVSVRVDFGKDIGQNFGTLFEALDSQGNVVAGAGFLGAYNTQARTDRRMLHVYMKGREPEKFGPEPLPRANADAGVYLFEFDNQLFANSRGGLDNQLRVWNAGENRWDVDETTSPFSIHVADQVLAVNARMVTYGEQRILEIAPDEGTIAENYYANGYLVLRIYHRQASPPVNKLVACRWSYEDRQAVPIEKGHAMALGTRSEFVYAFGQLQGHIVAATNTGGVYVFAGESWRTLRAPQLNVSFQIYAMLNHRDKLLMGQYPTGELFSYDGQEFKHLPDWPPVMPGVSKQAREAQTLTMYGGDIYAGVWPWGEVWRYAENRSSWTFMGRMFTHPNPTTDTTHPYEEETTKLDPVLNRWGQRVTSLVPLGDSLYISTSAKSSAPYEPKFTFLTGDKWLEYGAMYRYHKPGCLAVHTRWIDVPTTFEFHFSPSKIRVLQDAELLGEAPVDADSVFQDSQWQMTYGNGIFGTFQGQIK